jgi:hypothetical protein
VAHRRRAALDTVTLCDGLAVSHRSSWPMPAWALMVAAAGLVIVAANAWFQATGIRAISDHTTDQEFERLIFEAPWIFVMHVPKMVLSPSGVRRAGRRQLEAAIPSAVVQCAARPGGGGVPLADIPARTAARLGGSPSRRGRPRGHEGTLPAGRGRSRPERGESTILIPSGGPILACERQESESVAMRPCTVITWRVNPDSLAGFLKVADALVVAISQLPAQPGGLILLQAADDPLLFQTLGWWNTQDDLVSMRSTDHVREKLDALVELCDEVVPAAYRVLRAFP